MCNVHNDAESDAISLFCCRVVSSIRRKPFIMDQLMEMMVIYASNLEVLVNERTQLLYEEKQKTEDLLHRMLPELVSFCFYCISLLRKQGYIMIGIDT